MIPKIKLPYYPVKVPDLNKTINLRPYTIEVEKYLISLDDQSDVQTQINVLCELIKYCVIDMDFDINELQFGTIIWLFLKCYEISVKNTIDFSIRHKCDKKKEEDIKVSIPIKDIQYEYHNEKAVVPIDTEEGKYFIEFNSLRVKGMKYIKDDTDSDTDIKLIASCIDRMYDETGNNEVELTDEDKETLVKSVQISQLQDITPKILTVTRPRYTIKTTCPNCGKEIKETVEDFFI